MYKLSRSVWMVLVAFIIILVGLFLVCAQRRAADAAKGDDLAVNDDQFKQELLQLLDLTEDSTAAKKPSDADITTQPQDDVLALLQAEKESKSQTLDKEPASQKKIDAAPQTTSENLGISSDMFRKLKGDVDRLERTLENRSSTADSLRKLLDNRNARLQDLEQRLASASALSDKDNAKKKSGRKPKVGTSIPQGNAVSSEFKSGYDQARSLFEEFKYREAINAFSKLLEQNPDDALADNSQYWIGESYFGLKEYQQAIMEFQKVFAYSMTDKYDDAQLMIGMAYMRSGQKEKAQKEFETFLNNYATSEYAGVARKYYRDI
jgi:TolA-binding protein